MTEADELIGKTFGAYTILGRLGEGGMAVVYKGHQESLNRYVAIKVLREELARNQEFIARFRREALSAAKLDHPNILHVYDAGMAHGRYYIAMDYADGGSLKDLIRRGPLDIEWAISITIQLAEALDYAHRQGLVHRDVKPANVLLTRDRRPVLSDFGIAKALYESTHLTQTGASIGTPAYMSPEQLQAQAVDGRTDIYALGIVLFEMLMGWTPFNAPTPIATLYKQMNEPPPPLRQVNINIPEWLEAVVNKALAKQPEQRYQRASDMAEDLRQRRVSAPDKARARPRSQPPTPVPYTVPTGTTGRPVAKRRPGSLVPLLIGVIVALLLVLLGGGAYLLLGSGKWPLVKASPTVVAVVSPGSTTTLLSTLPPASMPSPTVPTVQVDTPTPFVVIMTATPLLTTPPTATPPPTAPPANPAPTKPPVPSGEPGVIASFENFGTWKRGDQPNGTFTQSNAQVHQGSYSGKLDYTFNTSGNDYVVFQQAHSIAGQPTRITAWVYGDGSGNFLNVWIKDQAGQVWQVPLGTITHTGWQQMVGVLDVNQAWPWTHISGPDNGAIDYPVSFLALVLDDKPDSFTGSGTIYIDDLRADTGGSAGSGPAPTTPASGQPGSGASPPEPAMGITGRIAFSAGGALHIANAKAGQDTIAPVPNMRQPDFRADGQLVIVNGEGGGKDSLWTVRASEGLDKEQSNHPDDYYPFFFPKNPSRFVYDSTQMGKGDHNLFIGNLNNRKENRDPLSYGGGPVIGSHPFWLDNDMVVYTGCDYGFGGGSNCGLYLVPSWGGQPTRIFAGGLTDLGTDGFGSQILFTSQRDGNWELYLVNANGAGLRNLSNSSGSNDGLGTFSPDGKWVAFVSNRGGSWAIWAVRPDGTGLTKLFDLPAPLTGNWIDERISWGP